MRAIRGATDPVAWLKAVSMDAARVEFETERTMMESIRLIRIGPDEITRHRDGISINSAFVRFASTVGLFNRTEFPQPGSTGHKQAIERYAVSTRTAAAFVWLATTGNTRSTQVSAGRAYARLQLAATAAGVGMHPLSQALQEFTEMRPHYEAVHRALLGKVPDAPTDSTLQMLCRVGHAAEVGPTPRRGVAAIIRA